MTMPADLDQDDDAGSPGPRRRCRPWSCFGSLDQTVHQVAGDPKDDQPGHAKEAVDSAGEHHPAVGSAAHLPRLRLLVERRRLPLLSALEQDEAIATVLLVFQVNGRGGQDPREHRWMLV